MRISYVHALRFTIVFFEERFTNICLGMVEVENELRWQELTAGSFIHAKSLKFETWLNVTVDTN